VCQYFVSLEVLILHFYLALSFWSNVGLNTPTHNYFCNFSPYFVIAYQLLYLFVTVVSYRKLCSTSLKRQSPLWVQDSWKSGS